MNDENIIKNYLFEVIFTIVDNYSFTDFIEYYTIEENNFIKCDEEQISAELFQNKGFLDIPTQEQIQDFYSFIKNKINENLLLKSIKLMGWYNNQETQDRPVLKLSLNAEPLSSKRVSINSIRIPYSTEPYYKTTTGIKGVTIESEGDLRFKIAIYNNDNIINGISSNIWKYFDGNEWVSNDTNDGMTAITFMNIPNEKWKEIFNVNYDLISIMITFSSVEQKFNSLFLEFEQKINKKL